MVVKIESSLKMKFISHGNNSNIHNLITLGSNKYPLMKIKVVCFMDSGKAFVLSTSGTQLGNVLGIKQNISHCDLFDELKNLLIKHDFELQENAEIFILESRTTTKLIEKYGKEIIG